MTETRIRWTKEDDGGTAGRAGTLDEPLFFIYPPESPGKAHILTAMLPGHTRDFYPSGFVSDLKAKAEEWLEEFVSSLGAIFGDAIAADLRSRADDLEAMVCREPRQERDNLLFAAGLKRAADLTEHGDTPGTTAATAEEKE